jgi:hypothetical protein
MPESSKMTWNNKSVASESHVEHRIGFMSVKMFHNAAADDVFQHFTDR